jgi:hypothetical protein
MLKGDSLMAYLRQSKSGPYILGPLAPRRRKGEVLPVPPQMLPKVWKRLTHFFRSIPDFDVDRQYSRLLGGFDQLWLAIRTAGSGFSNSDYIGVLVTTVTNRPPSYRQVFNPADRALRRSLTVHMADGLAIEGWIQSAVERITKYGKEQGCRQLFIKARKSWRRFATRFYSRDDWDRVAYSRDRPTRALYKHTRNRMGYYRVLVPVEEIRKTMYNVGPICYFKEKKT